MTKTVKVELTGDMWSYSPNFPGQTGDIVDAVRDEDGDLRFDSWVIFEDPDSEWSGREVQESVDLDSRTISFHPVKAPSHYNRGGYELLDVIEAWDLDKDAYKKEAVCYIMRSAFKGSEREDIEKAVRYLNRWLERNKKGDE